MNIFKKIYFARAQSQTILYMLYILWVVNKNNNYWPLHCVLWINSNLRMGTIYLVFFKSVTALWYDWFNLIKPVILKNSH